MNTKQKATLQTIIIFVALLLASSCNEINDIGLEQSQLQSKAKFNIGKNEDFKVSTQLLKKYLKIKKETPLKITPVVIDGDTLAYKLNYKKGWKLISGDQRISPIITESESDIDLSNPNDPNTSCVSGLLYNIRKIRESREKSKSPIWELLEERPSPPLKKQRKVKTRGLGRGMWIPTDTTFGTKTYNYPHVITTSWHQGYPYNIFCPIVSSSSGELIHAPVGCVPVAVGQVIYHYRINNNRNIEIPTSATGPTLTSKEQFDITSKSVNGWKYLSSNNYYVAMFLRDLGKKMHTEYRAAESGTAANKVCVMRDYYMLNYAQKEKYDYGVLISHLQKREPVIVAAKNTSGETGHFFIIDGYKEVCENLVIKYEWDETHEITDDDFNRYPQEVFEPDPKGGTEKYVEVLSDKNTYITMNWGWQTPNTTWYIAHEYSASYEGSDFAGSFTRPGKDYTYSPYWTSAGGTYNSVAYMFYNFQEFYPGEDNTGETRP